MLKNLSIAQKYGLIAGIGSILYMLIFYFWGKRMLNPAVFLSSMLIYIGAMLMGGLELRSQNSGKLSFKEGLRTCFVIFLLANLCYYVFYYCIFQYDPELTEIQNQLYKEYMSPAAEPGRTAEEILQAQHTEFEMTLGTIIFTYAKGVIGGFVLSVMITYLIKRE